MKITAQDLLRLGVIDGIVAEPTGGAHRDPEAAIAAAGDAIEEALQDLGNMGPAELRDHRADKFLQYRPQDLKAVREPHLQYNFVTATLAVRAS